jgi:hypothetical protein
MARTRDVSGRGADGQWWWRIAASVALSFAARNGQSQTPRPQPPSRYQPEARADFIDSRATAAHLGVGITVPAGTYVRLGLIGAVGQAWSKGESTAAGRVDGLVRFVVDPFREFRWAPYAAGGIGAIYDGREDWRGVLVGVLGVEGPAQGRIVPAIEVGFGGGARVGVALRRAMRGRR